MIPQDCIDCFIELHIEQGPLLLEKDVPLAIPTMIRGNFRYPVARCIGAYGHVSTTPRTNRQDAVMAVSELALGMDDLWETRLQEGDDSFVVTFGRFFTDPDNHGMTKVPGEVEFSINIGSGHEESLASAHAYLTELIATIEKKRRVRFELGKKVVAEPVALDPALSQTLTSEARKIGVEPMHFATAGHDAGVFALSGVPTAMILLKNRNGGHNPDEHLAEEDFAMGCRLLARTVLAKADAA